MTVPHDYPPRQKLRDYAALMGLPEGTPEYRILERALRNAYEDGALAATPRETVMRMGEQETTR